MTGDKNIICCNIITSFNLDFYNYFNKINKNKNLILRLYFVK